MRARMPLDVGAAYRSIIFCSSGLRRWYDFSRRESCGQRKCPDFPRKVNAMKYTIVLALAMLAVPAQAQDRNAVYYLSVNDAEGRAVRDGGGNAVVTSYIGQGRADAPTLRATDPVTRASLGLTPTSTILAPRR